ncbi:MAG: hypothetical protein R3270_04110 [Gammaproteobacteria bacterium]|nr:hypothetical protein [Gammaproteobacteria bacterium]
MTAIRSTLVTCLLLLAACVGKPTDAAEDCVDCITAEGHVRYSQVEGGFWYLEADDGAKYDPYGIPEEFAHDGLRVKFTVKPQPERMGFHMVGTIVELVDIEALEAPRADR